jgi:type I restriction enzyme S subunit
MNHNTGIPQLRFQEFDGEWQLKNFEEITSWASGGTPPKDNPLFWDGDIPWISASSMRGTVYSNSELKITNAGLKKGSKLAKKGSLLILVRGSMLFNKIPIGIVSKDVAFNQDVKSIVVNDNYSTSEFILNWFTGFEPKILNMVTGTGIGAGKLDLPDLKALKISLPTLPEQQKIASFLSAVDEKIQQLSRKKELLEQYKKGLMQQLFSGKLRFKDVNGNDYADWEEKKLGDFKGLIHGDGDWILSENIDADEKYSIIQLGNIGFGKFIRKPMKTLSEENFKIVKGTLIENGDLLINRMVDVNLNACVFKFTGLYVTSVDVCWIRAGNNINNVFFSNLILTEKYQKKLLSLSSGSGRVRISKKNFFDKFYFEFPCLEEQQKIADFLSGIDAKTESVNQQITQTQTFKKGLLQQLFV